MGFVYLFIAILSGVESTKLNICYNINDPNSILYKAEDWIYEADKILCSNSCQCELKNITAFEVRYPAAKSWNVCTRNSCKRSPISAKTVEACPNFNRITISGMKIKVDVLKNFIKYLELNFKCVGICNNKYTYYDSAEEIHHNKLAKYLFQNNTNYI